MRGLVEVERRHADAGPEDPEQPFLLQPPEGLADRRPADAESRGKLLLPEPGARRQVPAEDGVAQRLGRIVDEAALPGRPSAWGSFAVWIRDPGSWPH
jgi:hypothetical protein